MSEDGARRESSETDDQQLAAVVAKPRSQVAIESLRAEGVYDDTRSITEWTADSVAVPVTAPPQETQFREVVRQVGERRLRTLDDHLRERSWSDEEIAAAPSSWAVLGSVVLVDIGDSLGRRKSARRCWRSTRGRNGAGPPRHLRRAPRTQRRSHRRRRRH